MKKPPVIILGGAYATVSLARSLGRRGVDVYISVIAGDNPAQFTRYAKQVISAPDKNHTSEFWWDLLMGGRHPHLTGSIIFPCSDDGIEFVADNRDALAEKYILDGSNPRISRIMLNKKKTLELAHRIGQPYPRFVIIESESDIEKIDDGIQFPLIVKPQESYRFQNTFEGKKLFFARNPDELHQQLEQVLKYKLKVILNEMIPGPDTQLSSYYTYMDQNDRPLFHFTKKVIRRFPKNNGLGCYHITKWDPEIADLGLEFFKNAKLKGLGNVEFKKDLRDGKWKIMECNVRFTAAQELLVRCGMDISWIIYSHLAGLPVPRVSSYRDDVTLWNPWSDYFAYRELKALGEMRFSEWLKSIARKQVLPNFQFRDPMPTVVPVSRSIKRRLKRWRL